jgi:hypothetical protein
VTIELIANFVVAVLLAVMIAYCFVLNRRLGDLRNHHQEMLKMIDLLNQASERAQMSIHQLNAMGQEVEHKLKMEVARARSLADELSLITEAGGDLADRIELGFDQQKEQAVPERSTARAVVDAVEGEGEGEESDWLFRDEDSAPSQNEPESGKKAPAGDDMLSRLRSAR